MTTIVAIVCFVDNLRQHVKILVCQKVSSGWTKFYVPVQYNLISLPSTGGKSTSIYTMSHEYTIKVIHSNIDLYNFMECSRAGSDWHFFSQLQKGRMISIADVINFKVIRWTVQGSIFKMYLLHYKLCLVYSVCDCSKLILDWTYIRMIQIFSSLKQ